METKTYTKSNLPSEESKSNIVNFLFEHLENYGDPKEDILAAIDYSLQIERGKGGFTMVLQDDSQILGAVVVNQTGMKGYIPENILVYIATHGEQRGKGLGKTIMKQAIEAASGDIALHVEKDNPAKFLYEKLGFTNPYLEMRLKK